MDGRLRILFVTPAYWPAVAFGGPVPVLRALAGGLVARGHAVDVLTTTLESPARGRSWRSERREVDGACVHYLATPAHFRWMGFTPSLPLVLRRLARPDVVHVFGFRDPLGTAVAAWCRAHRVPYAFEALGMFEPKLRKLGLKRALDSTAFRAVPRGARRLVAASSRERDEYLRGGLDPHRVVVRPNGFPPVANGLPRGRLRARLGVGADTPLVLSVGRVAGGKGLHELVRSLPSLPDAHLAVVGPDDGHGTTVSLERESAALGVGGRVHVLGQVAADELPPFYADADVFALASAHENFGMVAAEAAAVGTAVLVSDRCGVAELLRNAAVVVPYEEAAVRAGLARLLGDAGLRARLGAAAQERAADLGWEHAVDLQERIYREAVAGA